MTTTTTTTTRYYVTAVEFRRIPGGWADVPAGWYANHQDPEVAREAFTVRATGATYQQVADQCQIQTFRMAEQAVARHARATQQAPRRAYARQARRTTCRRFGIELEFNGYGLRTGIVAALQGKNIPARVENYNHDVTSYWKMTTDATVTGGELVSPIMSGTAESLEQVLECIRTIKDNGGTTGRNVGMHVHHDVNDFSGDDMERLVQTIRHLQNALAQYVPRHRYDGTNTYGARLIRDREWDLLEAAVNNGQLAPAGVRTRAARVGACPVSRYSAVNFNSVLTYGTVEIRLLGNTLNTAKVKTWVETTTAIFRAVKAGAGVTSPMTPQQMVDWLIQHGDLTPQTGARYVAVCAAR